MTPVITSSPVAVFIDAAEIAVSALKVHNRDGRVSFCLVDGVGNSVVVSGAPDEFLTLGQTLAKVGSEVLNPWGDAK